MVVVVQYIITVKINKVFGQSVQYGIFYSFGFDSRVGPNVGMIGKYLFRGSGVSYVYYECTYLKYIPFFQSIGI